MRKVFLLLFIVLFVFNLSLISGEAEDLHKKGKEFVKAKKYRAKKIFLIYPANENFTRPIETIKRYEEEIEISVIPVDLSHKNEEEIIFEIFHQL